MKGAHRGYHAHAGRMRRYLEPQTVFVGPYECVVINHLTSDVAVGVERGALPCRAARSGARAG